MALIERKFDVGDGVERLIQFGDRVETAQEAKDLFGLKSNYFFGVVFELNGGNDLKPVYGTGANHDIFARAVASELGISGDVRSHRAQICSEHYNNLISHLVIHIDPALNDKDALPDDNDPEVSHKRIRVAKAFASGLAPEVCSGSVTIGWLLPKVRTNEYVYLSAVNKIMKYRTHLKLVLNDALVPSDVVSL